MRLFKRKLSILLILVLLVSILLPGVSAFAQSINSVKVNQESVEETVTFNNENQTWKENVQLNGSNSSSIEKVDVEPQNVVLVYATILIQRVGNTFYNAIQRVSATPATQTVYRSFTANNFRYKSLFEKFHKEFQLKIGNAPLLVELGSNAQQNYRKPSEVHNYGENAVGSVSHELL